MTADKAKFFKLLENYPSLKGYWSRSTEDPEGSCDIERAKKAMKTLAYKQDRVILSILVSIWAGGLNDSLKCFRIDFTDLYAYTEPRERAPLIDWLKNPYWP